MSVKLHAPQKEAVASMHNGCILYGDVGVGKTITSLAYYFERVCGGTINKWGSMTTPKNLIVITTAKVRDSNAFEVQASAFGVHTDAGLSTNGVSITVDSWNNLHKYVEVEDAFFIFDEQRVVGYGAWSKAFIKIAKHNEWILLSATPGDTWLDYIPVFIANGWYRNKTHFLDEHVIWTPRVKYPKVLRYQNVNALVRRRNEVLVRMEVERHTRRHAVDVVCDYDEQKFEKAVKKRWHVYENRPLRDVSELFGVMRKIVNSDSSRLEAVRRLSATHPKLIVFYNFDYELEMLRSLASPDTAVVVTGPNGGPASSASTSADSCPNGSTETLFHSSGQRVLGNTSAGLEESGSPTPSASKPATSVGDSQLNSRSSSDPVRTTSSSSPTSTTVAAQTSSARFVEPTSQAVTSGQSPPFQCNPNCLGCQTGSSVFSTLSSDIMKSTDSPQAQKDDGSKESNSNTSSSISRRETSFAIAEWNGHKHEEIPQTERWLYLVQYRAGAEGWNCIETDAICFFSQTYSYRDWWQAHGRIDRINTPFVDLYYYHLISKSLIDKAIRAALRAKKSFNEKNLDLGKVA